MRMECKSSCRYKHYIIGYVLFIPRWNSIGKDKNGMLVTVIPFIHAEWMEIKHINGDF